MTHTTREPGFRAGDADAWRPRPDNAARRERADYISKIAAPLRAAVAYDKV